VLSLDAAGTTVAVHVTTAAGTISDFVVRLDRAAQLSSIERVGGLPAAELGELSLSEIFPAAAGAPPERPVSPGQRWRVDQPLSLPGTEPSRLVGAGRLTALEKVGGRRVATVTSSEELTVRRDAGQPEGRVHIAGSQTTRATTSRSVTDGAVERMTATTTGNFSLTVSPGSSGGPPVTGTLQLELRSTTRRLR
jgi:hypothetical protein